MGIATAMLCVLGVLVGQACGRVSTAGPRPPLRLRGGADGSAGDGGGGSAWASGDSVVPPDFDFESLFDGCRFGHCMIRVASASEVDEFLQHDVRMQLLRKEEFTRFGRVAVTSKSDQGGVKGLFEVPGPAPYTWGPTEEQMRKARHTAASSAWSFGRTPDPDMSAEMESVAKNLQVSAWPSAPGPGGRDAVNWTKAMYGYGAAERHFAIQVLSTNPPPPFAWRRDHKLSHISLHCPEYRAARNADEAHVTEAPLFVSGPGGLKIEVLDGGRGPAPAASNPPARDETGEKRGGSGAAGDRFAGLTIQVGDLEDALEFWAGLLCMSVRHWQAAPALAVLGWGMRDEGVRLTLVENRLETL